jgi:hypothetical protein
MANQDERRLILEMIENGKVTPAEGLRLLQALGRDEDEAGLDPHPTALPDPDLALDSDRLASLPATAGDEAEAGLLDNSRDDTLPGLLPEPVLTPQPVETGPAAGLYEPAGGPAWSGADSQPQDSSPAGEPDLEPETYVSQPPPPGAGRRWWMIPLWIGVGVTILGAVILYAVQRAAGVSFWFFCAGLPLLLGVALIALAWGSRTARWIHIRVEQSPGDWPPRIALSFPLPLRFLAWFLRTFRSRIPGLGGTAVDEVIMALKSSATLENPFYFQVENGEDGERVEIFIA